MLHSLKGKPDAEILKALDLRSEWFLKEYRAALPNYSQAQVIRILSLLKTFDLRSKGVENDSAGEAELMKELFWRMMN
jgi:DNA polymerase-3 subunit delta